jgi:hypothetical protein
LLATPTTGSLEGMLQNASGGPDPLAGPRL